MTPLFKKALCGLLSTLIVVVNPPVYGYLVQPPVMIPQVVKMAVVGPMEVDVVTDDQGRVHRVRETRRVDAEGNLLSRQVVDKFKIGKTRAKIVATYDADNNLTRLVEKYTTKVKGGKHVLKFVSTQFDENGNPLDRRKVTDKVVRDRSFSNLFRANLAYGPVGLIWALADPNSFYKFSESQLGKIIRMTNQIIFTAIAAMTGNPFLVAGVQFLNTYANTGSFKAALIGAAIAFAAFVITAGIASFLQNVKLPASFSNLESMANQFGSQLAKTVSPQAFSVQSLTQQVATRVAAQQFEQAFGKKLGAFGTAAILSFTIAVSGQLFGGSAAEAARLANPQYYTVNSMALRALAQGGIAEAFKNEKGLGAQFARELSSNLTAGLSTGVVSQGFQQAGKTFTEVLGLFNPRTPAGRHNLYVASRYTVQEPSVFSSVTIELDKNQQIARVKFSDGSVDDYTIVPGRVVRTYPETKITDLSITSGGRFSGKIYDDRYRTQYVNPEMGTVVSINKDVVRAAGTTGSDLLFGPRVGTALSGSMFVPDLAAVQLKSALPALGNVVKTLKEGINDTMLVVGTAGAVYAASVIASRGITLLEGSAGFYKIVGYLTAGGIAAQNAAQPVISHVAKTTGVAATFATVDATISGGLEYFRPGSTPQSIFNTTATRFIGTYLGLLISNPALALAPRLTTAFGIGALANTGANILIENKMPTVSSTVTSGANLVLSTLISLPLAGHPYATEVTSRVLSLPVELGIYFTRHYGQRNATRYAIGRD